MPPLILILRGHRNTLCECGKSFPMYGSALQFHKDTECEVSIIFCENMCGGKFERRKLAMHLATDCKKRLTTCPLRCGADDLYLDHVREKG